MFVEGSDEAVHVLQSAVSAAPACDLRPLASGPHTHAVLMAANAFPMRLLSAEHTLAARPSQPAGALGLSCLAGKSDPEVMAPLVKSGGASEGTGSGSAPARVPILSREVSTRLPEASWSGPQRSSAPCACAALAICCWTGTRGRDGAATQLWPLAAALWACSGSLHLGCTASKPCMP